MACISTPACAVLVRTQAQFIFFTFHDFFNSFFFATRLLIFWLHGSPLHCHV
jgi:hypothetical protein